MDATQIILIVFIVALIIIYPIMIYTKNKKENQRMQEQTNSLKRGDKVLTTSGVYGTIVDLHQEGDITIATLETGKGKNIGYLSVHASAIYQIIKDEPAVSEPEKTEVKEAEPVKQEEISEKPQEVVSEEPKDEVTVATEEPNPKKSKKKKSN